MVEWKVSVTYSFPRISNGIESCLIEVGLVDFRALLARHTLFGSREVCIFFRALFL